MPQVLFQPASKKLQLERTTTNFNPTGAIFGWVSADDKKSFQYWCRMRLRLKLDSESRMAATKKIQRKHKKHPKVTLDIFRLEGRFEWFPSSLGSHITRFHGLTFQVQLRPSWFSGKANISAPAPAAGPSQQTRCEEERNCGCFLMFFVALRVMLLFFCLFYVVFCCVVYIQSYTC